MLHTCISWYASMSASLAGLLPFFVNCTSGTTVLGAFDPINEIADICEKHGIWLHIDVRIHVWENKLETCHVVPNCYGTPISKFYFKMMKIFIFRIFFLTSVFISKKGIWKIWKNILIFKVPVVFWKWKCCQIRWLFGIEFIKKYTWYKNIPKAMCPISKTAKKC